MSEPEIAVPRYLATPFRRLLDDGHARLDNTHLCRTETGRDLYLELSRARGRK